MGADANVCDKDCDGKTPLGLLFNNSDLGKYLLAHGANMFHRDDSNQSVLAQCMEYGETWILFEFQRLRGEYDIVFDEERLYEYVIALITVGHAAEAANFIDVVGVGGPGVVCISKDTATALLARMSGRLHSGACNMRDPVGTFELLMKLGAEVL